MVMINKTINFYMTGKSHFALILLIVRDCQSRFKRHLGLQKQRYEALDEMFETQKEKMLKSSTIFDSQITGIFPQAKEAVLTKYLTICKSQKLNSMIKWHKNHRLDDASLTTREKYCFLMSLH